MTDSIARNNHVINARTGILLSESPNNQIYNNIVEGATSQGIRFFNPELPDDGVTEGNLAYNNVISDSQDGVSASRSQNNIVENTTFSDIEESEYHLAGNSGIIIRGQQFDDALISGEGIDVDEEENGDGGGEETENIVQIVGSGRIQVIEGADDGEEENGEEDEENGEDEDEADFHNTDIEPYTAIMSDGDSITVNSSSP
jgi:parallel beta-helix repeat protein